MTTELVGIPAICATGLWPEVSLLLKPAVEEAGEMSLDYVLSQVLTGAMQLWVAQDTETGMIKAAGITTLVVYPERKSVRILHLGGADLPAWKDHIEWIGTWGLAHGAVSVEAYCRPGITKAMKAFGFQKRFDVIELDLRRRLQ
jgi:hypothetical protein